MITIKPMQAGQKYRVDEVPCFIDGTVAEWRIEDYQVCLEVGKGITVVHTYIEDDVEYATAVDAADLDFTLYL